MKNKYVMDICELCKRPIGYDSHLTDSNGQQPLHTACLDEADLEARGFIPAGREEFRKITGDLISPNEGESKGKA